MKFLPSLLAPIVVLSSMLAGCAKNPDQADSLIGTWEDGRTSYEFRRDHTYSVSVDGETVSGVYEAGYDNVRLLGRQRYTVDCDGPITNLYDPVSCTYEEMDYYERYEGNILRLFPDTGAVSTLSYFADDTSFAPGA